MCVCVIDYIKNAYILCILLGHLPLFTVHPRNNTIILTNSNTNHSLSCNAIGASSYYWQKKNDNIPSNVIGMNTNTITFVNLQPSNAGFYRCVATNDSGSSESYFATVAIDGKIIFLLEKVYCILGKFQGKNYCCFCGLVHNLENEILHDNKCLTIQK